ISSQSFGKTNSEVAQFLSTFVKLGGEAERRKATFDYFGNFTGAKLLPQLKEAGTQLGVVAGGTEAVGGAFAAAAAPLGIMVVAIIAAGAEYVRLMIDAAEQTAEYGAEIERASEKTKLGTLELSGLRLVAEQNKVGFEDLVLGLSRYLRNLELARQGNTHLRE